MSNYGVEQITTLEGIEAIRKRPGMYVGSVGLDGVHHITLEIISNIIDEYLNGHCSKGMILLGKDGSITIADNGRGIPVGKRADGMETLEAVFTKLHTGAKFSSDGKTGYNTSGGMNGVGAKATNALSEYFIVSVKREGKKHTMRFEKGKRVAYEIIDLPKDEKQSTGTTITFKPDKEIFKDTINLEVSRLKKQLKELAFLSKGMGFILVNGEDKELIKSENGLLDYVEYLNGKHKAITSKFYTSTTEDRLGVEVALMYNETYSDSVKLYTNNIPNSSGTHLTGFRTALTRAVNDYARDKKILKEKEDNLTGEDLKEGLVLVLSLKMPDPVFSGQTKDVLTSSEGRGIVERLVSKEIRVWLEANPNDAKSIINKALLTRKAREAAKKARETARKKATSVLGSVLPGKLADCQSNKVDECEIYLVEGDSAAGTAKDARDRVTQAILPLRGKVLNVMKADLSKAMNNAEIRAMVTAFGLETDGKKIIVNEDKLRYDKIVIMTDGDVDGSHIRILLLTFLWVFAKDLILNGHVYAAVPPLYKVTKGKDNLYLLNDAALEEYKAKNKNANLQVQRFKGLGEMNAEQLEETTMSKENRILKQITAKDMSIVEKIVQNLMGEQVSPRKDFIEKNAHKAKIEV